MRLLKCLFERLTGRLETVVVLLQLQVLVRQYFETFTGLALRALMLVKGLR